MSTPRREGSCEGRMRKDEKSLKVVGTDKWERGGQRTHPTEATRRRVMVAREECREERGVRMA
jgi:hypothetical protein